jgi:hypothetical protein
MTITLVGGGKIFFFGRCDVFYASLAARMDNDNEEESLRF